MAEKKLFHYDFISDIDGRVHAAELDLVHPNIHSILYFFVSFCIALGPLSLSLSLALCFELGWVLVCLLLLTATRRSHIAARRNTHAYNVQQLTP